MTDNDFIAEMRRRINPIYEDQIGTESWERKRVLAIIEKLEAERDAMANPIGDHALISVPRKDFRRIEAEREELQGKLNRARVTFENPLLAKLEGLTKERNAFQDQCADLSLRNGFLLDCSERLHAERDALAAQVVAMRDELQMVATARPEDGLRGEQCDNGYSPEHVAQQAIFSIDTASGEK